MQLASVNGQSVTVTVPETARLLGISDWKVKDLIRKGEIPVRRYGRRVVVPREWIENQGRVA